MEGDINEIRFILYKRGSIKPIKPTWIWQIAVTGIFGPGQFIGQLSLLTGEAPWEILQVIEKQEIFEIPKTDFICFIMVIN
jgi:hypothetical protein